MIKQSSTLLVSMLYIHISPVDVFKHRFGKSFALFQTRGMDTFICNMINSADIFLNLQQLVLNDICY